MITLPYKVFIRREGSSEPWRAPIWRSFSQESDAERELLRLMEDRTEHAPVVFANITGPDEERVFIWADGSVLEIA